MYKQTSVLIVLSLSSSSPVWRGTPKRLSGLEVDAGERFCLEEGAVSSGSCLGLCEGSGLLCSYHSELQLALPPIIWGPPSTSHYPGWTIRSAIRNMSGSCASWGVVDVAYIAAGTAAWRGTEECFPGRWAGCSSTQNYSISIVYSVTGRTQVESVVYTNSREC